MHVIGYKMKNSPSKNGSEEAGIVNFSYVAGREESMDQECFDKLYQFTTKPLGKDSTPKETCLSRILAIFPFFGWIRNYDLKRDLMADFVAGCTVGVMQIPQGLAASMLAGVPPITGLYMAFFPVFVYIFMGTSRHISLGTIAVVCIMTKVIVVLHASPDTVDSLFEQPPGISLSQIFIEPQNAELTSVQVAMVVCFAVGLWQFLMGLCRLGNVSVILSDTLVSGFSTAAAVHVMASQLASLLGISIGKHNSDFKIILIVRDVMKNISSVNLISLWISLSTMAVLVIFTEFIKPRLDKKFPYPIPIEMFCIIAGILLSEAFDLGPIHNVKCLGPVPRGLPSPSVPPLWLLPKIIFQSLPIALVAFTITLSMASILAKKGSYKIRANQEFIALGSSNMFVSIFSCVPVSASLSRSMIQQKVGGKTQIANLFTCGVVLLTMLIFGPFFRPLPHCVLAAILIVTLKGMLLQIMELPRTWRKSKFDGLVWAGTFFVSVLWDIDYGLGTGLILSALSILIYGQKLELYSLGKVPGKDIYLDMRHYQVAHEVPGVKIISLLGSLHFANKHLLENEIAACIINQKRIDIIILDMAGVCFIDFSASEALMNLRDEISKTTGGHLRLANCAANISRTLLKCVADIISFPTIHDALISAGTPRI